MHHQEKKELFYGIIYDLFIISFIAYLIFIFIDRNAHKYISDYFNPNLILIIIFLSGFLAILKPGKRPRRSSSGKNKSAS